MQGFIQWGGSFSPNVKAKQMQINNDGEQPQTVVMTTQQQPNKEVIQLSTPTCPVQVLSFPSPPASQQKIYIIILDETLPCCAPTNKQLQFVEK